LFVGADIVIVWLCSRVALFHSTHSRNTSYQTNSELKHGHNKVDVPPERRRFGTGKACTTAKLSRTSNVKLLWMLQGRDSGWHILGYAWEICDQWRLEKCRAQC
jgi:hypothetical protein